MVLRKKWGESQGLRKVHKRYPWPESKTETRDTHQHWEKVERTRIAKVIKKRNGRNEHSVIGEV